MIHPDTEVEFISDEIGYGVFATQYIPMGSITWVRDEWDREIVQAEYATFDLKIQKAFEHYAYRNGKGNYILCWDHTKFMNHSFNANCFLSPYEIELAVRDILPGEQLTNDYGFLNIERPFKGIEEGTKRKWAYPDDLVKYHKIWDRKLRKAFKRILLVTQPLRPKVSHNKWEEIEAVALGKEQMGSILNCYFKPSEISM